jgi:hypothetical protein
MYSKSGGARSGGSFRLERSGIVSEVATLIEKGETPGPARQAIGAARKSMREPGEILAALQALRRSLAES